MARTKTTVRPEPKTVADRIEMLCQHAYGMREKPSRQYIKKAMAEKYDYTNEANIKKTLGQMVKSGKLIQKGQTFYARDFVPEAEPEEWKPLPPDKKHCKNMKVYIRVASRNISKVGYKTQTSVRFGSSSLTCISSGFCIRRPVTKAELSLLLLRGKTCSTAPITAMKSMGKVTFGACAPQKRRVLKNTRRRYFPIRTSHDWTCKEKYLRRKGAWP